MATIFGERLAAHAADAGRGPAWIDGDREVAFGEAAAEVSALAAWLIADGVAASRVVGVSMHDDRRDLVAGLALLALGVPHVLLAASDPVEARRALARRIGVDRVLTDDAANRLEGAPARVVPVIARRDAPIEPLCDDPDAPAVYFTSSGTTGRPKVLAFTQRGIALRAARASRYDGHAAGERIFAPMRSWTFGACTTRLYAILDGATSILPVGDSTAAGIVGRCVRTRATILHLSAMLATSLATARGACGRLAGDVKVFSTASRLPAGTAAEFERRIGGRLYDRYGTTEVGLVATTFPRGDEGLPDSVGRILPGVEVEIVDARGVRLPAGEIGEIRARTPQMTTGYVDDPELDARHFRDGWFHPGDAGAITAEGVLRFLGRSDDMMSLGGFNIFPSEIEHVLDDHPAVRASAAFPLRSAAFGEIPAAAVELESPGAVTAAELLAYARSRLGVRAPRRIEIVGAMPRNAAGKVLKRELARRHDADAGH